jgi:hypothetical protein
MKRRAAALLLIALLLGPADAALAHARQRSEGTTRSPQVVEVASFTGHHCRIATCRFFTSSYSTAIYYYDRRTCGQWKSLSKTYLHGFRRRAALLRVFPDRNLHPPC